MSDLSPEELESVVSTFHTAVLSNRIILAANVLWLYDLSLTIIPEINNVWSKPTTFVSLLYLVNRYSFLMFQTIYTYLVFGPAMHSNQYCYSMTFAYDFFQIVAIGTTSALFALRVYAIYYQALWVLILLGMLGLARVGLNIYYSLVLVNAEFFTTDDFMYTGFLDHGSCLITVDESAGELFSRLSLAVSLSALMFELLVFGFTLKRTWSQAALMRTTANSSVSLLILRDGIMYFFFVFASGTASAGVKISGFARPDQGGEFSFIATSIDNVLPNLLISRLYLNLKSLETPDPTLTTFHGTDIKFASNKILGNIGASLNTGGLENFEDGEEYGNTTYETSWTVASQSQGTRRAHQNENIEMGLME